MMNILTLTIYLTTEEMHRQENYGKVAYRYKNCIGKEQETNQMRLSHDSKSSSYKEDQLFLNLSGGEVAMSRDIRISVWNPFFDCGIRIGV